MNALAALDCIVDVCDPDEWCICRFSQHINKVHRTPAINEDPIAYLKHIRNILVEEHYDVLLPIHENAYLFAKAYAELSPLTNVPVASFESFQQVQSKVEFTHLLRELRLPHPPTRFANSIDEVLMANHFPKYIKTAYGTAGNGTWLVKNFAELKAVGDTLKQRHMMNDRVDLIVQDVAPGKLCVAQSVFDRGQLLAIHMYEQTKEGVGGSASARIAVDHEVVRQHVERIGTYLNWHGSLMIDYLYDATSNEVAYIEANPRPGETMNATLSGVNLIEILVEVAMGERPSQPLNRQVGTLSHSGIAVLLGIAERKVSRWAILKEAMKMMFKLGDYHHSEEDLTPIRKDWPSVIPLLVVFFTLLLRPASSKLLSAKTVNRYSLGTRAVSIINSISS